LFVLHNPVTNSMAEPGGQCLEEKFQKKKINHSRTFRILTHTTEPVAGRKL
jgi:hypothetical protein